MKIAIFTNNYLPNPYGVSTSVETFRREFEKRGHTVYIFAPRWPGYIDQNPNVFRYPSLDINIKFRFPLAIPYSFRISKIIKNLKTDLVHSQHPDLLGSAAAQMARKKKIPLVFTWHTLYNYYAHFAKIIPERMAARYMIKKAVRYANRADAVVVPTDSVIPIIRRWGVNSRNIFPVATGVTEEDFQNADRKKIRGKYKIAERETLLLMVSRLTEEKNAEFVFRSVRNVLKSSGEIKFMVAGDGYLRPRLEKFCQEEKISGKVIFCGVIARREIKDYFAAADIFVYGSKSETQGMIISEAMYMGLPLVAVEATGVGSLVLNNGNGFLVREDEKEFSRAVFKLAEDKNLRDKFGKVSRRIAKMQFTSSVCAQKMLEVYRKTLERHNSK